MRRPTLRPSYAKATMTKAQNRNAYRQWLHTCDLQLLAANGPSVARCHGISAEDLARDIADEPARRARVAALFEPQRLGEPQS